MLLRDRDFSALNGVVLEMEINLPPDMGNIMERRNPWSVPKNRNAAEAIAKKWRAHQSTPATRGNDFRSLCSEIEGFVNEAVIERSEDGNPEIAGIDVTPILGVGHPETTEVVFLNDEAKKSDAREKSFIHDYSFFSVISEALKKQGIAENKMFAMTVIPINTERKVSEDAVRKVFWPLALARLRILRPKLVIALNAGAAQPVYEKFNTEAKVGNVPMNEMIDIEIGTWKFKFVRVASRWELEPRIDRNGSSAKNIEAARRSEQKKKEFEAQIFAIAQFVQPRAAPALAKRKSAFDTMMMAAQKKGKTSAPEYKADKDASWELDGRVHVSKQLVRVAREALVARGVKLFVNVGAMSIPPAELQRGGARLIRVTNTSNTSSEFSGLVNEVKKAFDAGERVAIYDEMGTQPSARVLASLMAELEKIPTEEAVRRTNASRKTEIEINEL